MTSPFNLAGTATSEQIRRAEVHSKTCYAAWQKIGFANPSPAALSNAVIARAESRLRYGQVKRYVFKCRLQVLVVRALYRFRSFSKFQEMGKIALGLTVATLGVLAILPPLLLVSTSLKATLAGIAATVIITTSLAMLLLYSPSDLRLTQLATDVPIRHSWQSMQAEAVRRELLQAELDLTGLRKEADIRDRYLRARDAWESAKLRSKKDALLKYDWRSLAGVDFELFLGEVFRELGFGVQFTKTSRDQGVDLILTRLQERIAVQAKGYSGSVGNSAVMEVSAGMNFYQCRRAIVVTNSYFTPAAYDLARANACSLIDGSQIPALINGHIL